MLALGWVLAALGLYAPLLLLDVYWNLVSWHPHCDKTTAGLMLWIAADLLSLGLLAHAVPSRLSRGVSLILALLLLGIGVYACPPEPLGTGLFGRAVPSPVWYRGIRLLVLAAPLLMWLGVRRKTPASKAGFPGD